MLALSLAVLCNAAGVGSLYASWRQYWPRRLALPAGWLLLGLSSIFWLRAAGAEFGTVYALLCTGCCAWLAVALNYETRRRWPRQARPRLQQVLPVLPDSHGLWRHLALFLGVVPLAGYATILLSVTLAHLLPWADADALVAGILLMPVLWGLASFWLCADSQPLRPALTLVACALLCSMYVYG